MFIRKRSILDRKSCVESCMLSICHIILLLHSLIFDKIFFISNPSILKMTFHHLNWHYCFTKMSRLKKFSVICSYVWLSLYTIQSPILVNINFSHMYIVHYEDGNSNFHVLTRHLFEDLMVFNHIQEEKCNTKLCWSVSLHR